jgi:Hint domain/RTX calcium-binding nonapeptide repeat (4 copies)
MASTTTSLDPVMSGGSLEELLARMNAESTPANGTSGNDILTGTDAADRLFGRAGDDEISGGEGADSLDGGSGDDALLGGEGNDWLRGGSGDDDIDGGEGDDAIKAGSGDDTVTGGGGDDEISTGSGDDRITFTADIGDDVITDFKIGSDVIDLTAFGDITSVNDLTFTTSGNDTVITADGFAGSITVKGVSAAALKASSSIDVACYLQGTLIQTPTGDMPIEQLAIGDLVITADGSPRRIRWLGYRSFTTRFLKPDSRMLPVTVKAGALGDNLPRRDLHVSPGHSLLMDGVFVNADLLINGVSVLRQAPGDEVAYVHIELDTPDAIIAEGIASETYVNDGNRRQFENWQSYAIRYGDDHPVERLPDGLVAHRFPHADAKQKLPELRARVNTLANIPDHQAAAA